MLVVKVAKKKKHRRRSGKTVSPQLREATYQSGLSHFREGKYEQAIRAWRGIVEDSEPMLAAQLAEAHFRNAMSKYESGDMKTVISELHSALKYDSLVSPNARENSSHPVYLFHIGLAYHRMGKFPQAISYYTRAVQIAPEVERYRYHLGLAHLQSGDIQKSIESFKAVKGIHGRVGEALVYISQGDHERALELLDAARDGQVFEKSLRASAPGSEIRFLKGLVYLSLENDKKAKPLLKAAADDGVGSGASDYYLGLAHARSNAIPSAVKAWEDASRKGLDIGFIKDDMADVYRQLAVRYFNRDDLSKVVEIWEKLLEVEPEDDEARRNLVHAYFLRGNDRAKAEKFADAIKHWEKAWELDSTNVGIAHNLALAYEKQNKLGEAAKYWKTAVSGWKRQMSSASGGEKEVLQARMHTVHTHLADIALEEDNTGRAIAEYRQALRYAPKEVRTIVKLADLYMMEGSSDRAIDYLSQARRLSPKDTDVLEQMSFAYLMRGSFSQSVECMKEILRVDPGNQLYRELVGGYYLDRAEDMLTGKKHEAALRFINEGLEVCPGNIKLQAFVGAVYLNMGNKPKAEAAFREIIAKNPMDTKTYLAVAHQYLNNDMMDDASGYFAEAIKLAPGNPYTYIDIASEYCHFDMCEDARRYFEMAKKLKPGDASILMAIVDKLLKRECSEYGLQYAKELMSIAPDDPKSYFLLGLAYHLGDMNDEALDTLTAGMDIAKKTGNKEVFEEIDDLFHHIEFERSVGGSLDNVIGRLMGGFDEEEW